MAEPAVVVVARIPGLAARAPELRDVDPARLG
jgi:hypothetical protein